jgi:hypothetical protein
MSINTEPIKKYTRINYKKKNTVEEAFQHPINKNEQVRKKDECLILSANKSENYYGPLPILLTKINYTIKELQDKKDHKKDNKKRQYNDEKLYSNSRYMRPTENIKNIERTKPKGFYYLDNCSKECIVCEDSKTKNRTIQIKISNYSKHSLYIHQKCCQELINDLKSFVQKNKGHIMSITITRNRKT